MIEILRAVFWSVITLIGACGVLWAMAQISRLFDADPPAADLDPKERR